MSIRALRLAASTCRPLKASPGEHRGLNGFDFLGSGHVAAGAVAITAKGSA